MCPDPARRTQALAALTTLLTLVGIVLAVVRPAWLTGLLTDAVQGGGAASPALYLLLCALAAPLHLSGLLMALSTLTWPAPVAWSLSYVVTLLGCLLTSAALYRSGRLSQTGWPAWLNKRATSVGRRPVLVGLLARLGLGTGCATRPRPRRWS